MSEPEIKNAKITGTMLGFEDHGILTAMISLDYGGSCQGFGGYCFGNSTKFSAYGTEFIAKVLQVVGVEKWEDLKGKHVRVVSEHSKVHRIGNIIEDKWFDPEKAGEKYDKKAR